MQKFSVEFDVHADGTHTHSPGYHKHTNTEQTHSRAESQSMIDDLFLHGLQTLLVIFRMNQPQA